jgi:hypothetical protein
MSRTTILVLVAFGAVLAGFALSTNARRLSDDEPRLPQPVAASPQRVTLGWRDTFGPAGDQLVFTVEALEIVPGGWRARVGLENGTSISYEVARPTATPNRTFGLMLFTTGEHAEVEEQSATDTLPPIRPAVRFEPRPPRILEPGASWTGTISAPGALVANSWVRVMFGALVSVGTPPDDFPDFPDPLVWISDETYRLQA